MAAVAIAARNELAQLHVPLVKLLANKQYYRLAGRVELDDLIADGYLGLLDAAGRFDASRGLKFATFANRRIIGAMLDGVRSRDFFSRCIRKRLGANLPKTLSIATPIHTETDGREITIADLITDKKPGPTAKADNNDEFQHIIRGLSMRMKLLLRLRYIERFSFREIGYALGVSESRVSQMHTEALNILRWR